MEPETSHRTRRIIRRRRDGRGTALKSKEEPATEIQAIMIRKNYMNIVEAWRWIEEHGYDPLKMHETDNLWRFRIRVPMPGARYRTIDLDDDGNIMAVILVKN